MNKDYHRRKATSRYRYTQLKKDSKRRGIEFHLSYEQFLKLIKRKTCVYCRERIADTGSGLDRLNSMAGYHVDNVVRCCARCNWMKGNWLLPEEMHAAWRAIHRFRRGKLNT